MSKKCLESIDSTDAKIIWQIPIRDVHKMADLLAYLEENFLNLQIDIELNTLEDAYIKIAEDEVDYHNKVKQQTNNDEARLRGDVDLNIYDNLRT